jgi:hypothetical protein
MGTRSDIIVHMTSGQWARIYCHWDGYLEHNGRILFDHYTSQDKAEKLIALGDLSTLGPEIGRKHAFDAPRMVTKSGETSKAYERYEETRRKMCTAYGRDRGETDIDAKFGATLQEVWPDADSWIEFTYVWHDEQWFVASPDEGSQTLVNLGDALLGKETAKFPVKLFGSVIGEHNPTKPGKTHSWSR